MTAIGTRRHLPPHEPALHAAALGDGTNAGPVARIAVEAQPLGANIERLLDALDYLGAPVAPGLRRDVTAAAQARDADRLQQLLDDRLLLVVHINPEMRVKVARGPGAAVLQQAGYTPAIVKILNESRGTPRLRITSPQAGPVYAGMNSWQARMQQPTFARTRTRGARRTLSRLGCSLPPMTESSAWMSSTRRADYSSEADEGGDHAFEVGRDAGPRFRAEAPVCHREAGNRGEADRAR